MEQTVVRIGNSAGIIIPQTLRRQTGLKPGDTVMVNQKGNKIILSPLLKKKLAGSVNAKFMKMVEEFMDEHEDVLRELAKR